MKLHQSQLTGQQLITGYGAGHVMINQQRHDGSLVVSPDATAPWAPPDFESLAEEHFTALLAHQPEIVVLGTGARLRFPHPRLSAALMAAGVGLEVMDTGAACRTYNILLGEGRRVVAALLPI